jgi:hypothetical protein
MCLLVYSVFANCEDHMKARCWHSISSFIWGLFKVEEFGGLDVMQE